MAATGGANQTVEEWARVQLDQGQQLHQGGSRDSQQVQRQPREPYPVLRPEVQQGPFRQVVYRELHIARPLVHQQQAMQQYQPQGKPLIQQQGQQLHYAQHNYQQQQQQLLQQQHAQQQHAQQLQQQHAQHQNAQQQQVLQLHAQQQYAQQQAQQQQVRLPRQSQHYPQNPAQAQTPSRLGQSQSEDDKQKTANSFETKRAKYVFIRRVAVSTEGSVSLASSTSKESSTCTKELRIVKSVPSNGSDPREAHMLRAAGAHPNVLEITEAVYDERWSMAYMCMEYCSGGDLQELKCEYDIRGLHLPTALIFKAIIDISDGLAFLHGGWVRDEKTGLYQKSANPRSIIHRDLKTSNIFIRPHGIGNLPTFVLGDFGQSFLSSEAESRFGGGTAGFRAPEFDIIPTVPITDRADVYSFAITIASVCQNLMPETEKFQCGSHPLGACGLFLPQHLQFYTLENFLRDCLAKDPRNRPEISPSGVLSVTTGYRTLLKSMSTSFHLPLRLRVPNDEVVRAA